MNPLQDRARRIAGLALWLRAIEPVAQILVEEGSSPDHGSSPFWSMSKDAVQLGRGAEGIALRTAPPSPPLP